MSTVLWGARKGDVQYASRDYWRHTIPTGDSVLTVDAVRLFDVGTIVDVAGETLRISGIEGDALGVRPL